MSEANKQRDSVALDQRWLRIPEWFIDMLSCPFCDSKAVTVNWAGWKARCSCCGISTSDGYSSEDDAIKCCNERANKQAESGPTLCCAAFDDALPDEIKKLVGRCEINEHTFDSDEMYVALKFGEMLWRRLARMADHYERQSGNFMPNDIRGTMMAQASEDMRHVLNDTRQDL